MKSVQMPDGAIIQFPADTSEETMNSVASDYWSKNAQTPQAVESRAQSYNYPTSALETINRMQPEIKGRSQAALMGAGQGLTANFADELVGAMGGDTNAYRQKLAQMEKQYPISFNVGQMGGAGLGSAAALTALPIIPEAIAASPSVWGRAALTGAASIPGGVLQGAGAGEGTIKQRIPSAVAGGLVSGLTGAMLSPLVDAGNIMAKSASGSIPLTAGQATQDLTKQAFESSALKGTKGEAAQNLMQAAREIQDNAINNRLQKLKTDTGLPLYNQYGTIDNLTFDLKRQRDAMKKQVSNAYNIANDSGQASIAATDVKSLLQSNINDVKDNFNLSTLPKGQSLLNELNNMTSRDVSKQSSLLDANGNAIKPLKQLAPVDIQDLERWRRKVSRATQSTDPEERAFATAMIKKYDDFHNLVLDNALVQGDEKTVAAYKSARDLRADFGKRFESNNIVDNILTEDHTPETVLAKIYGAGSFNGNKEAANTVDALLKAAGNNADVAKQQLKLAALDRVVNRSYGTEVDASGMPIISPAKLRTELNNLLYSNQSLTKSLFTSDDIATLKDTKSALDKIVSTKPGAINTSNSAERLMTNMGRLAGIPIAGDIARSFSNAKNARMAMQSVKQMQEGIFKPNVAQAKFIMSGTRAISPDTGLNRSNQ